MSAFINTPSAGAGERASRRNHIQSLDGIRGIAVIAVFFFHVRECFSGIPLIEAVVARGWFGVEVFFTLSGFLITRLLLQERESTGSVEIKDFYARRALRLVPAYLLVIAVTSAALLLAGTPTQVTEGLANLKYLLTYTTNFAVVFGVAFPLTLHFWSLAIEEQYYLLFPWLLRRQSVPRLAAVLAVSILSIASVRAIGFYWWPFYWPSGPTLNSLVYYFTPLRIDSILAGALAATVVSMPGAVAAVRRYAIKGWRTAVLIGALLMVVLRFGDLGSSELYVVWLPVMYTIVALLIIGVAGAGHGRLSVLESVVLVWIGRISYGFYLVHVLVIAAVTRIVESMPTSVGVRAAVVVVGAFVLTLFVSQAMYTIVEKPFLSLKKRFSHAGVA